MWYNSGMSNPTKSALVPEAAAALLTAPYVVVRWAPIMRDETLAVRLSLDARETWTNGIFENSRYGLFFVRKLADGRSQVECLSRGVSNKFRKVTVATAELAMAKIQAWVEASK